ncbi:Hsp20/alpha crystallin family protein [bacterium]|nr:Hsp20/alpha crystallin family protein [bacterium]
MTNFLTHRNNHNLMNYAFDRDFNNLLDVFDWFDIPVDRRMLANTKQAEPKIELKEKENEVVVKAEIPGINEKDIDLEISSDGYITISGEKKEEHEEHHKGKYFSEISYGSFSRTIPLPTDLKFDNAKADFENGTLTITVPKAEPIASKKKKIEITHK